MKLYQMNKCISFGKKYTNKINRIHFSERCLQKAKISIKKHKKIVINKERSAKLLSTILYVSEC